MQPFALVGLASTCVSQEQVPHKHYESEPPPCSFCGLPKYTSSYSGWMGFVGSAMPSTCAAGGLGG